MQYTNPYIHIYICISVITAGDETSVRHVIDPRLFLHFAVTDNLLQEIDSLSQ